MALNCGYWISCFFTPYETEAFVLRVAAAGLLSVDRNRMNPIAGFVAGSIGDRSGIPKSAGVLLLVMVASFAFFSITPADTTLPPFALFGVAWAARSIHALQTIHFALLDERGNSDAVTGTVGGAASLIRFTPDISIPVLSGAILDSLLGLPSYRTPFGGASGVLGCAATRKLLQDTEVRRSTSPGRDIYEDPD